MDDITRTQHQTQAYWFVDGIAELVGGAILVALGMLLYASTLSTDNGYSTLAAMTMIIGFPLSAKMVRVVKDRFTHERTGYLKYPEASGRRRGIITLVAAVVAAGLIAVAALTDNPTFDGLLGTVMLVALGVGLTAALALRARKLELPRFYINAVAVAVSSAICVGLGLSFIAGMGVVWIAHGVTSVLTGATVFGEYLTSHPEPGADPS